MSRIYWDSMLFIYWLEDHPHYAKQVDAIHSRMKQRQDRLITGAFTFGEVLAGTYRKGRAELADQMERRVVVPVPTRATGGVRPGDHLAQAGG